MTITLFFCPAMTHCFYFCFTFRTLCKRESSFCGLIRRITCVAVLLRQVWRHFTQKHSIIGSCCAAVVWFPECYRLHHPIWGWARAGEGVCPSELPGGCGAGVDHSGPGKVTCGEQRRAWGHKKLHCALLQHLSMDPLCVHNTSLC